MYDLVSKIYVPARRVAVAELEPRRTCSKRIDDCSIAVRTCYHLQEDKRRISVLPVNPIYIYVYTYRYI